MRQTPEFMDCFQEVLRAPVDIRFVPDLAMTGTNSVVIAAGIPWKDVVQSLVEQSHHRALLPTQKTCITDMFRANGFMPVRVDKPFREFFAECNAGIAAGERYIVKSLHGYHAFVPDAAAGHYVMQGARCRGYNISNHIPDEVWHFVPGTDNRTGIKRAHQAWTGTGDRTSVVFKNENPEDRNTGDCVIRGLCAAYGCTWHDAIDHIARAIDYSDPTLNVTYNINITLEKLGFVRKDPIRRHNRLLDGKQFCDLMDHTCFKGERIFAYVGRSHCAAVLPTKQSDGSVRYMIQDTWDSSERYIGEYWIYLPPAPEKAPAPTVSGELNCGSTIHHPQFGEGVLLSSTGSGSAKIWKVSFKGVGDKYLSETWLKKAMTAGSPE